MNAEATITKLCSILICSICLLKEIKQFLFLPLKIYILEQRNSATATRTLQINTHLRFTPVDRRRIQDKVPNWSIYLRSTESPFPLSSLLSTDLCHLINY